MDIKASKPVSGVSSSSQGTSSQQPVSNLVAPETVQPVAPPPVAKVEKLDVPNTQQAISEQVSRYLQSTTRNLEFHVDKEAGVPVIVVSDVEGNVIRRIPGEEALEVMRRANADLGTLIDSSA
jgi:uncharacterized FlaG/YvyC family protein